MQYFIRFECYAGPDRQVSTPVCPDIAQDSPPSFGYGQLISVGDDADDPQTWPRYYVAHFPHLSQIEHPDKAGKNAGLMRVMLARTEEWDQFDVPEEVQWGWEAERNGFTDDIEGGN